MSASPRLFMALSREATSSESHIQPSAWSRQWKKEAWLRRLSGWATWERSRRTAGQDWWTPSRRPSRARATASPAHEEDLTTLAGSGPRLVDSYALYDPATLSWRTSQVSLLSLMGDPSADSSVTWTRSGTTRSGAAYRLPRLAPPTGGTASGSSHGGEMWPTPRETTGRASRASLTVDGHWSAPGLEQVAELAMGVLPREFLSESELTPQARRVYEAGRRLWPTPRYADSQSANQSLARRAAGRPPEHVEAAARETMGRLWATPSASPWRSAEHSDATWERNARPLNEQALRFQRGLHSPTTRTDGEPSSESAPTSLQLNPLFDEWLLFGLEMIGWTCVCPARVRVRGASLPSVTPSVLTSAPLPSEDSGTAPSERCRDE